MVNLIVAVDKSNSIGWSTGSLPWKIPLDMARFKQLTTDNTILMGWNTFKSLGRAEGLPRRENVVITRKSEKELSGFFNQQFLNVFGVGRPFQGLSLCPTLADYILAHQTILGGKPKDLWVIGGAAIYKEVLRLNLVDKIYLTQVHTDSTADVKFDPQIYNYEKFIANELLNGIEWKVESVETPIILTGPSISFITLKKV